MKNMLHLIEKKWKGRPVIVSDSKQDTPRGWLDSMEWRVGQGNVPKILVTMSPMFPEDEGEYVSGGHSLVDNKMVFLMEPASMKMTLLNDEGGYTDEVNSFQMLSDEK